LCGSTPGIWDIARRCSYSRRTSRAESRRCRAGREVRSQASRHPAKAAPAHRQAKAHRCAVVEDVKSVPAEAEGLGESLHELSQMIEGVFERLAIRRPGETETWQIRRNHVIAIGKRRDKLPIHVRGGGKAVQQQNGRRLRITGLAIEYLQSIDGSSSVSGGWDRRRHRGFFI
jgi:hypothetical protein